MRRSHNAKFLWLGFIAVLVVGMLIGYSVSSLLGKAKNSLKDLPMVEKIYQESSNHAENLHYDVVQNIYDERHNAITKAVGIEPNKYPIKKPPKYLIMTIQNRVDSILMLLFTKVNKTNLHNQRF